MTDRSVFNADVVDLFAGPGGWDYAARLLGLDVTGIEHSADACATRRAAGLPTIEGDVRDYGPDDFPRARGLIASPPCQPFSTTGNGKGRAALATILRHVEEIGQGIDPDLSGYADERVGLVLEPLRWVAFAQPSEGPPFEWLAFEQVPSVLPVWEAMAVVLRAMGYTVVTGILYAEQYGTPQTRKRAVLLARWGHDVELPKPTHSRWYAQDRARLDPGVLPWVSMSQALGWPSWRVGTLRSNYGTGGDPKKRGERSSDDPAPTVTSKIDRNVWLRFGMRGGGTEQLHRHADDPAPTLAFGRDSASWCWADHVDKSVRVGQGDRLTLSEAGVLQGFPAEYPWQGRTGHSRFGQVGNAVPVPLALAVLRCLV